MSMIRSDPDAVRSVMGAMADRLLKDHAGMDQAIRRMVRLGMSPRQLKLNRRYSYYACVQYEARTVDWDGNSAISEMEHEVIATAGFVPPGFYDARGSLLPLRFRKPSSPYHLGKVIPDRFTSLLFSERRHPTLRVDGDPDTEDFLGALAEASRLWARCVEARAIGGAMGSVAVGYTFRDGMPIIEVHDPRYLFPKFKDRGRLMLESVEKRYVYPEDERDRDTGRWKKVWYWYRRVIDEQKDTLFEPVRVDPEEDEEQIRWVEKETVPHPAPGFCPVVWVQNLPVIDDLDGESDCHGVYDQIEAIDALLAQAQRGVIANCDPTLVLENVGPDFNLAEIAKGSGNAIKLPQGSAKYLEISGTGPKAALELVEQLRRYVLEVSQCVLEHPDTSAKTATEVERSYSSMLAKADVLREQYGQRLVLPLVTMMLRTIEKMGVDKKRLNENLEVEVNRLYLPLKVVQGEGPEDVQRLPRKLGNPRGEPSLRWPGYFEPSLQDAQLAATAATAAKTANLVTDEVAAKMVTEFFKVDDVPGMLAKLREEKEEREKQQENLSMLPMGGKPPPPGPGKPPGGKAPPEEEPEEEEEA